MLAPESRTLLLEQLAPPPGRRFDRAVATTFTLDLTSTLIPALAFTGYHLDASGGDPIATLEAIRSTADRIDVFCQAGAIQVPAEAPDLLAFLEPMVHPVRPPSGGLFHPKVWFVRYLDDNDDPSFRLLVLTRNLTTDASWDLAVRLDGTVGPGAKSQGGDALGEFIAGLPGRRVSPMESTRSAELAALARQAAGVEWELPAHVEELRLHVLDEGRKVTPDFSGSRHLVVSPFVDPVGLARVAGAGSLQVLSRAEELEKLPAAEVVRVQARVLDDLAVAQNVDGSRLGGQLHAKMYVVEPTRTWSKAHVFIGSANATAAAFSTNTEFLVELRGHKRQLGIDRFLGEQGAFFPLTEPYAPTGEVADDGYDAERELDAAVRRVASMAYQVEVVETRRPTSGGAEHDLRLRSERSLGLEPHWQATVELLTLSDFAVPVGPAEPLDALVAGVVTADVTPFVVIRVETPSGLRSSTVVVAELVNPPDDRLDVVLARQIDNPDKFFRFLFFLLSLGSPGAIAATGASRVGVGAGGSPFGPGGHGVLEMVLGALATRPSVIADLDSLVRRLQSTEAGRGSLPEGFADFWLVVREAAGLEQEG